MSLKPILPRGGPRLGTMSGVEITPTLGWRLSIAVQGANVERVNESLQKGADINDDGNDGMTALHWAFYPDPLADDDSSDQERKDMEKIVKLLVKSGANVGKKNVMGWTPLHFAARGASLDSVKFLLVQRPDVNAADNRKQTPLFIAAMKGRASNPSSSCCWPAERMLARSTPAARPRCTSPFEADMSMQLIC